MIEPETDKAAQRVSAEFLPRRFDSKGRRPDESEPQMRTRLNGHGRRHPDRPLENTEPLPTELLLKCGPRSGFRRRGRKRLPTVRSWAGRRTSTEQTP